MSAYPLQSPIAAFAKSPPCALNHLTKRQHEVVRLLGEGLSNKRIARALDVTEGTVKQHIKGILEHLGASNRLQIVIYAYRSGILSRSVADAAPAKVVLANDLAPLRAAAGKN